MADIRWKDIGEHLSQTVTNFETNEEILYVEVVDQFDDATTYFAATRFGQIKRVERKEFSPWRTYKSKSVKYAKLKDETDQIVAVAPIKLDDILLIKPKMAMPCVSISKRFLLSVPRLQVSRL